MSVFLLFQCTICLQLPPASLGNLSAVAPKIPHSCSSALWTAVLASCPPCIPKAKRLRRSLLHIQDLWVARHLLFSYSHKLCEGCQPNPWSQPGSRGLWKAGLDSRFWFFRNACASSIFPQFAGPGDKQEFLFKGNLESHFKDNLSLPACQLSKDTNECVHEWDDPCWRLESGEDCPIPRGRMCFLALFSLLAEWCTVVDSEGNARPKQVWLRLSQTLASTFVLRSPC